MPLLKIGIQLGGYDYRRQAYFANGETVGGGYGGIFSQDGASGGGGWGSPQKRDPELIKKDVEDGLISEDRAKSEYVGF